MLYIAKSYYDIFASTEQKSVNCYKFMNLSEVI